jgi:hypothetical protein
MPLLISEFWFLYKSTSIVNLFLLLLLKNCFKIQSTEDQQQWEVENMNKHAKVDDVGRVGEWRK